MLKSISSVIFENCQRHGLTTSQTIDLLEEYEIEFGKHPGSFGDLLEVLE